MIYLPNSIDYYIAYFAVLELDSVILPIHVLNTVYNLNVVRNMTDSRILITTRDQEDIVQNMNIHIFYIDENCLECPITLPKVKNNNIAKNTVLLLETSGSTSKSKLVMLTEENILSNIFSIKKKMRKIEENAKALILSFLGSSHGNTCEMLFCLYYKIPVVLYDGLVSISKLLKMLSINRITRVHLVSPLLILLCKMDKDLIGKYNLSQLCRISFGSCIFPKELLKRGIERFPNTMLIQDYGLTEAAPLVASLTENDWLSKFGSIGKQLDGIEIRISNEKNNMGELHIKGENVTPGYYKNILENESLFDNGWLRTKDIVSIDNDGYLYFQGRMGRIIKSNGYRVNPEDVESVILSLEGVQRVLVYGTCDEIRDSCIHADIVLEDTCKLSTEEIIFYCRKHLPSYKIPHKVNIVHELEITASGKVKVKK